MINPVTKVNSSDELVKSFVPVFLQKQYAADHGLNTDADFSEDYAVLLWIDIASFSPLCTRLMKDTVSGVEKITGILHSHYDDVLSLVTEFGGQPLLFAGDGVMSSWPHHSPDTARSVGAAAACAAKVISNRRTTDDNNELLSLHVLIAAGPWQMAELEGVGGNRLVSFFGQVFSDLSAAARNKAPDQILITDTALSFLTAGLQSEPVQFETSILHSSPVSVALPETSSPFLSDEAMQKLQLFIPRTLSLPLHEEHLKWIAEIRPVTILFVKLPNKGKTSAENLRQLRTSVELAGPLVQKYEGLLNQVWIDEKESNMLICFGPPPSAHINNPERSVHLGFDMHHLLKKAGIENSVGLSSGMAYCGLVGNNNLRQYTVIGDVVNMSARIAGIEGYGFHCDKATYNVSKKTVHFSEEILAVVKGRKDPISLHVPLSILHQERITIKKPVSVGRTAELSVLTDAYRRIKNGNSECIIMEGESGMGKTLLLEEFISGISRGPVLKATGLGDFVLRSTPYASVRSIISTLLEIGHPATEKIQSTEYDKLISRFGNKASLLNIVLNTTIPDSDETKAMTSSQRVLSTEEFLLSIVSESSCKQPLVLVIDDARWVDTFSLKFIGSVKDSISHCLIVLVYEVTEGLREVQRLKADGAVTILLKELADKDIIELICARLGVAGISADLAAVMLRLSKGNPFFCNELAGSFLDHDLLVFENGSCSLAPDADINIFSLPETVRGAIRSRIDRLKQGAQLSLKIGSVVGKRFPEKIISNIYPIIGEKELVPTYLQEAEQVGFLNEINIYNLNGYLFNSATTAEVAYEMTLAEQRRQLHRGIAEWYELNFSENLHTYLVRLANHWIHANEKDKATDYYVKEATRLFQLGFVKEALNMGLEGVKLLGQEIPRDLDSIIHKIGENMMVIGAQMQDRTIESLTAHKKSADPNIEKIIHILLSLGPFAHQSQQAELFALMTIICQRLTLEYGNGDSAAEVYAMYAIIHKTLTGDVEAAFNLSNISIEVDKRNGYTLESRVLFMHGWFVGLWKKHMRELIPLAAAGADAGFREGDILFACFNLSLEVVLKSVCGFHLSEVIDTATRYARKNNQAVINAAFHLKHEKQVAKAFLGKTSAYTSLTDDEYDEEKDIASICKTDMFNQIAYYLVSKLKLCVHFGVWEEAVDWAEKALPFLPALHNQPGEVELEQFHTMAVLYKSANSAEDMMPGLQETANAGIGKLKTWASFCPENFLHKALLVDAVCEGVSGNYDKAESLFRQAADAALVAGYIQDQALAYEHLYRMKKRLGVTAAGSLQAAISAYEAWGAEGKVTYLKEFVS